MSSCLQFNPIEKATKASGLPWTIIRLPIFIDNTWCVRMGHGGL
jgi:hypothetical protein